MARPDGLTVGEIVRAAGLDTPTAFSDAIVGDWRNTLQSASEQAQRAVARSMAETISTVTAGSIIEQASHALSATVRQSLAQQIEAVADQLRATILEAVQPAALIASLDFSERMRNLSDEAEKAHEALWRLGWWMPPSLSTTFFWQVGRLAGSNRRLEVRRAMLEAAQSRDMLDAVHSWLEDEPFRSRRAIILDGVRDHRRRRYRVSIPTLLPTLEGIAVDAFAPGTNLTSPVPAIQTANAQLATGVGDSVLDTVTVLWTGRRFSATQLSDRALNRHLILHGHSTRYGTAVNSAKVLFALDQLAAMVSRFRTVTGIGTMRGA